MKKHLLDTAYTDLASAIALQPELIELKLADITKPEAVYATDSLIIRKGIRSSGGYAVDQVVFIASREILRHLALLIAATVIHDQKRDPIIKVELNNPESEIRALFIDCHYSKTFLGNVLFGRLTVDSLSWAWRETGKHPWCYGHLPANPYELPCFDLTDNVEGHEGVVRMEERHYLRLAGRVEGFDRLISFLLNIADDRNEATEFDLEGEDGFRGVAPASAEARFGLPGSIWWQCYGDGLEP